MTSALQPETAAFRPLADQVLLRRVPPPGHNAGLLWIPDGKRPGTALRLSPWGVVFATGPKVSEAVKVGDVVHLLADWGGHDLVLDGHPSVTVPESGLACVLDAA